MTWAEAVSNMTTSPIFFISLFVFLLTVIFVMVLGIKKGWIKFRNKNISVGSDIERNIILTQMSKVESTIADFYNKMSYKRDDYRKLYICSEVEDLLYRAVATNHINLSPIYVSLKQEAVWSVIVKYAENNPTEELHTKVNEALKGLVQELVDIRAYFTGSKM